MNLGELANRPRMYADEDGVNELMIGLMCIVTGSGFLALQNSPRTDNIGYIFVPAAIMLCGVLVMALGTKKLKERITYPRGGYVALDVPPVTIRRTVLAAALTLVVLFGMGEIIHFRPGLIFHGSLAVAGSAMFFGVHIFNILKYRMLYMLWLAAFSAVLGVWVYVSNDSLLFVMFWQGVALAIAGGIKLLRFMKAHPRPVETEA